MSERWFGPVCVLGGVALLGLQVYMYVADRLLSSGLIGWGAGLTALGGIAWFYYFSGPYQLLHRLNNRKSFAQSCRCVKD